MILRRFMKHINEQNWFAVGLDVLVVIVGIFLGLQVQAWYADRGDRVQEGIYTQQLIADLEIIELNIFNKTDFMEKKIALIGQSFFLLNGEEASVDKHQLVGKLALIADRKTLLLESSTFNDLQSTGNLRLIRDEAIRNEITLFFASANRVQTIMEKNNRDYIDEGFIPFLKSVGISYQMPTRSGDPALFTDTDLSTINILQNTKLEQVMNQINPIVSEPFSASGWQDIKRRLSWQLSFNVHDASLAKETMLKATNLKNRLLEYQQH